MPRKSQSHFREHLDVIDAVWRAWNEAGRPLENEKPGETANCRRVRLNAQDWRQVRLNAQEKPVFMMATRYLARDGVLGVTPRLVAMLVVSGAETKKAFFARCMGLSNYTELGTTGNIGTPDIKMDAQKVVAESFCSLNNAKFDHNELFSLHDEWFQGPEAVKRYVRFLETRLLDEAPPAHDGELELSDARKDLMKQVFDLIAPPEERTSPEPLIVNIHGEHMRFGLSAVADEIRRGPKLFERKARGDGSARRDAKDPTWDKRAALITLNLARPARAGGAEHAPNFGQVLHQLYIQAVPAKRRGALSDEAPVAPEEPGRVTEAHGVSRTVHEIQKALAETPRTIVFNGVYVPPGSPDPLQAYAEDDHIVDLILRLLEPQVCSLDGRFRPESFGRNCFVILSNRKIFGRDGGAADRGDILDLPLAERHSMLLPSPPSEQYEDVLRRHDLCDAASVICLRRRVMHFRGCLWDTVFFVLDAMLAVEQAYGRHEATGGRGVEATEIAEELRSEGAGSGAEPDPVRRALALLAVRDRLRDFERETDLLVAVVKALWRQLDSLRPCWSEILCAVAATPGGIRRESLQRLRNRARGFRFAPRKADGADRPLPAPPLPEMAADEVDLADEIDEMAKLCRSVVRFGRDDCIESIDEAPRRLELSLSAASGVVAGGDERHRSLDFLDHETREAMRKLLFWKLGPDRMRFHALQRLLADEALQQATVQMRHHQHWEELTLRPSRRLFSAFHHGLQSLPIAPCRASAGERRARIDSGAPLMHCAEFSVPREGNDLWRYLFLMCYRRLLERAPEWRLSRRHGQDALKRRILEAFDKPWTLWPDRPSDLEGDVCGLFRDAALQAACRTGEQTAAEEVPIAAERERSLNEVALYEDFTLSLVQACYSLGDIACARTLLRNLTETRGRLDEDDGGHGDASRRRRLRIEKRDFDLRLLDAGIAGSRKQDVPIERIYEAVAPQLETLAETSWSKLAGAQDADPAWRADIEEAADVARGMLVSGEILQEGATLPHTEKLVDRIVLGLRDRSFDPELRRDVSDMLFRLAETYVVKADLVNAASYLMGGGAGVPADEHAAADPEDAVARDFCKGLACGAAAEALRIRNFNDDPLAGRFLTSGHATRQVFRCALKLEVMARDRHAALIAAGKLPASGAFARYARRLSDTLARHLSRFPRERVSMLIMEAAMLRLLAPQGERGNLEDARRYLAEAERQIVNVQFEARIRMRLILERAKLHRHLAMTGRDDAVDLLALCEHDLDRLGNFVRRHRSLLWELLERIQRRKLDEARRRLKA